jgi:hypothetical protein
MDQELVPGLNAPDHAAMEQELIESSKLGPRKKITARLETYLDDRYPLWQGDSSKLPEGLRIEMHPETWRRLVADPNDGLGDLTRYGKVWLPMKINSELHPGQWLLVEVTKDYKIGGMIP